MGAGWCRGGHLRGGAQGGHLWALPARLLPACRVVAPLFFQVISELYDDPTDLRGIEDPHLRMQARSFITQAGGRGGRGGRPCWACAAGGAPDAVCHWRRCCCRPTPLVAARLPAFLVACRLMRRSGQRRGWHPLRRRSAWRSGFQRWGWGWGGVGWGGVGWVGWVGGWALTRLHSQRTLLWRAGRDRAGRGAGRVGPAVCTWADARPTGLKSRADRCAGAKPWLRVATPLPSNIGVLSPAFPPRLNSSASASPTRLRRCVGNGALPRQQRRRHVGPSIGIITT